MDIPAASDLESLEKSLSTPGDFGAGLSLTRSPQSSRLILSHEADVRRCKDQARPERISDSSDGGEYDAAGGTRKKSSC